MPTNDDWNEASMPADTVGPDGELDPDAREGIEHVLGFELPAPLERSRRSRVNVATVGLAALVLAAGAFYAGVRLEKTHAKSSTNSNLAAAFSRFAGAGGTRTTGTGAGGSGTGSAGAAGVTFGQVKLVDGKNVYVTDSSGGITKVVIDTKSTITVSKPGKVADVKPGDTVVVRGTPAKDGSVTATSFTDSGAGGGNGGGFGGIPGG